MSTKPLKYYVNNVWNNDEGEKGVKQFTTVGYQKNFNEDTVGLPVSAWNTGTNDNDIRLTAMYETT